MKLLTRLKALWPRRMPPPEARVWKGLGSAVKVIDAGGEHLATFDASPEVMDAICGTLWRRHGIQADWNYVGGRAILAALGDRAKAVEAIWLNTPRCLRLFKDPNETVSVLPTTLFK